MEPKRKIRVLKLSEQDSLVIAQKYFKILGTLGEFYIGPKKVQLTPRDIEVLAFTAIKGNLSYSNNREEFCTTYKSSPPTINNIISKLKKLNFLIKDAGKIKVNPALLLDFDKGVTLQISIDHG
jgi:hypothetical protein